MKIVIFSWVLSVKQGRQESVKICLSFMIMIDDLNNNMLRQLGKSLIPRSETGNEDKSEI